MIIDSFAGGGGTSLGIEWAIGRSPDIAINHDQRLVAGRKVELLWASPDCKHFSRAKGAKPVEKKIRSLAWVSRLTSRCTPITTKDRFGLVVVKVNRRAHTQSLTSACECWPARELARAQGFPDSYVLTGTKTNQVARIGNSVCPHVAKALVAANYSSYSMAA